MANAVMDSQKMYTKTRETQNEANFTFQRCLTRADGEIDNIRNQLPVSNYHYPFEDTQELLYNASETNLDDCPSVYY